MASNSSSRIITVDQLTSQENTLPTLMLRSPRVPSEDGRGGLARVLIDGIECCFSGEVDMFLK